MLLYTCPNGHAYGIAGYGEDLTNYGTTRPGSIDRCPVCRLHEKQHLQPPAPEPVKEQSESAPNGSAVDQGV